MILWSSLRPLAFRTVKVSKSTIPIKRYMSDEHRVLPLQASKWQWLKFKDYIHLYVLIGVIPLALLTTIVNVFIGPATLSEIPKGYEPKPWEYHRHPITRFIARYIASDPQQEYEKLLHHVYEEDEKAKIRRVELDVKSKMNERNDYQAYYYRPVLAKYHRVTREIADELSDLTGVTE